MNFVNLMPSLAKSLEQEPRVLAETTPKLQEHKDVALVAEGLLIRTRQEVKTMQAELERLHIDIGIQNNKHFSSKELLSSPPRQPESQQQGEKVHKERESGLGRLR
jgi:hypothetical protein